MSHFYVYVICCTVRSKAHSLQQQRRCYISKTEALAEAEKLSRFCSYVISGSDRTRELGTGKTKIEDTTTKNIKVPRQYSISRELENGDWEEVYNVWVEQLILVGSPLMALAETAE